MKLTNLNNCFESAITVGAKFIGVSVSIPEQTAVEVIINERGSFKSKQDYYNHAYNDDLNHKHAAGIKIVGFTYGNTFEEIQTDLVGL